MTEPGSSQYAQPGDPAENPFRQALAAGTFTVTAEIGPPRGADVAPVVRKAVQLRDWVHAVNITDNQGASVRLASLAGSVAALTAGVTPIVQLTTRDRNRIALQSDLLAASALGVRNVLIMTGDHPRHGDHVDAKPVFDLDSVELLRVARRMRDEGRLMSGRELRPPPSWMLGAVENPVEDLARMAAKVDAGAEFVQTQFVFDVPAFAGWLARVRDLGLDRRCHILAGVGPILSPRALSHLSRIPGVQVPPGLAERLEATPHEQFRSVGEQLCSEIIGELRELPGLAGVHVIAVAAEQAIPGILEGAGLGPISRR